MSIKSLTIVAPCFALGLATLLLAGCQSQKRAQRDPLPYSPNYHTVAASTHIRKGYEEQDIRLVPDACVTPDVTEDPLYLPPGCANNLNLQLMVEQQNDLLRGRKTGPAMAAPAVRAARRVIDGTVRIQSPAAESDVNTTGMQD